MTENEFKNMMTALLNKRRKDRPSHQIIIEFEHYEKVNSDFEEFIQVIQEELEKSNTGILEIYGIDEDRKSGDFLINCNESIDTEKVFEQIRPILDQYTFFENSEAILKIADNNGQYSSKHIIINEPIFPFDNYDELLPIPDEFTKPKGCLSLCVLSLVIVCYEYLF